MDHLLSIPREQYDDINRYFAAEPPAGKAAFLLSRMTGDGQDSAMEITDFISISEPVYELKAANGFGFQSPVLMDTIDMAMASCKNILLLYSLPELGDDSYDPLEDISNRVLFRIAYHYLPTGRHACLVYNKSRLFGRVWLRDSTTEPMKILIS